MDALNLRKILRHDNAELYSPCMHYQRCLIFVEQQCSLAGTARPVKNEKGEIVPTALRKSNTR